MAGNNSDNRKMRKSSAFWNPELAKLWSYVCASEKEYLRFKVKVSTDMHRKAQLKENYRNHQKNFVKVFRSCKRRHKKQELEDMASSAGRPDMWEKLKRLSDPKSNRVVMEIIRDDGTISNDLKEVLCKWQRDISDLY